MPSFSNQALGLKRFREKEEEEELEDETVATANCLMLLSKVGEATDKASGKDGGSGRGDHHRVFECKTCNKKFHSFQALGGHRASHKKLRLMAADLLLQPLTSTKPKIHACSICGLEFPLGQALGGHMRRHRAALDEEKLAVADKTDAKKTLPILMRSNSSKRIFGFDGLDLNLTPDENDSKPHNIPPLVDFFHVIA